MVNHDASSDLEPQEHPSETEFPEKKSVEGFGLLDDEIEARQRTGVRWIVASGLVLALGLGGWYAYRSWLQAPPEAIAVTTIPAQREDVEITVTAAGVVELGGQQTFTAPTDVTVEAVPVQEGQRVSAGEVLIVLCDREFQQDLNRAIIQTLQARNQFTREQERIQERQNRLARAQERLQESQALLDQGFISEDEFRADQNTVEDAERALRDAEVALANAELELRSGEAQVRSYEAQVADTRIVAPYDAVDNPSGRIPLQSIAGGSGPPRYGGCRGAVTGRSRKVSAGTGWGDPAGSDSTGRSFGQYPTSTTGCGNRLTQQPGSARASRWPHPQHLGRRRGL